MSISWKAKGAQCDEYRKNQETKIPFMEPCHQRPPAFEVVELLSYLSATLVSFVMVGFQNETKSW